ncbi:MAG: glycogen debranching protein [Lachnospiraceae bacterium]|nr:glycogen debranching protein [Lachnospiraceae bacterium]
MKYRFGKGYWRTVEEGSEREWLIANGIGGFSNCTVVGNLVRTQSSYLVASLNPPVDRINVLSKTKEMLVMDGKQFNLDCQTYKDYKIAGCKYLESFDMDIVPRYIYQINDVRIKKTIAIERNKNTVVIDYVIENGNNESTLLIKPVFACRDFGSFVEHGEELTLEAEINGRDATIVNHNDDRYTVKFYTTDGDLVINSRNNCLDDPKVYLMDMKNGYTKSDIGYIPFIVKLNVKPHEVKHFYVKCTIEDIDDRTSDEIIQECRDRAKDVLGKLKVRDRYIDRLALSADTFIVDRKSTGLKTVLAGYPWFSDWGRDTMIALQGLTLCTGRFKDNREILQSFAIYIKNGLIPNMFPSNDDEEPIYNTVDASMWYFYSVDKYLRYTGEEEDYQFVKEKLYDVLKQIIYAYMEGTDFSIKMDDDGLIMAGSGLDQVTWMDVRVGKWVATPRHGKPVEINALWYNALKVMEDLSIRFGEDSSVYANLAKKVKKSFNERFWNEETGCLYDVVDENDAKVRPNQVWAISLPYTMLDREKEKKIVNKVYEHLYTCYGMRTLSYADKNFKGTYRGDLSARDEAYHMGTVWPFLLGAFITAYCKVNNHSEDAVNRAEEMCEACFDHLEDGCLNAISEVFDGMDTCTGNGCFNQAWSVGELLRAYMEDVKMNK